MLKRFSGEGIKDTIHKSLQEGKRSFILPGTVGIKHIQAMLEEELRSNPELFYVSGFQIASNGLMANVEPVYTLDYSYAMKLLSECRDRRTQLLKHVSGTSRYQKILAVHDIVAKEVEYSMSGTDYELHSMVGPLLRKKGVCEGFAKMFKYLLDALEIPCIVVTGYSTHPVTGGKELHGWNLVEFEDGWYHVDVTFDTTIRTNNILRYDYFGLPTEQIEKDHEYEKKDYSFAKLSGAGYYERHGLAMKRVAELRAYLAKEITEGKRNMVFQLMVKASDDKLEKCVSDVLAEVLEKAKRYGSYILSCNRSQHVFHIHL